MNDSQYIKNISDGIIVLNNSGTIIEANHSAIKLLGLKHDYIGRKYADIMEENADGVNDEFHQVVVDSITGMPHICRNKVEYHDKDGITRLFQLTSSLVKDTDEENMLIITFTDITETTGLMRQRELASFTFVLFLSYLSIWIILYAVWIETGKPVSLYLMSKLLIYSCCLTGIYCMVHLKLKAEDCGLKCKGIKKAVITDSLIAVGGTMFLILIKIIILKIDPEFPFYCADNSFFDFSKYKWYSYLLYICSVVAQEFCSRGIIHEQARHVISSRHREGLAIAVSSLMFAAAHIHQGLTYMIAAGLLLGVLGIIYRKQGTIWGLCIPHFVLGEMIGILGFVVY